MIGRKKAEAKPEEKPLEPVIDLVVRYDSRNGGIWVTPIGGQLDVPTAVAILEAAKNHLHQAELEAARKAAQPAETRE